MPGGPIFRNPNPYLRSLGKGDARVSPTPGPAGGGPIDGRGPPGERSYEVQPPWLVKWLGARDFLQPGPGNNGVVSLPANSKGTDLGLSFTVPPGFHGVLTSVAIFVQNLTTSWNGSFTMLQNQQPIQGWTGLTLFPATLALGAATFNGNVRLDQGTVLTVIAVELAGTTWNVGAQFTGWYWPLALESQFDNGVIF